ncbi:trypsin-like serine protease [Micromonospora sp. NBC_01699]|uniref:S1 family peptidase n=1 Tax=Micromonospora sp. NBC_01699 TaxID=2975984 RepID=UPI002E34504F|nr:trypsin-like serine protease [Micromonospora sp. NBC_01699]
MSCKRRFRSIWLTAAALAAALSIVSAAPAHAVANGVDVPNGRYQFAVKLTMTGIPTADGGRRNSACSGALIHRQWIVTAGHCFRDLAGVRVERTVADQTLATIGRANMSSPIGEQAQVVAVRQRPDRDLALVKLDRPITTIGSVPLSHRLPQAGDVVRLAGFGSTQGTNPVPSDQLRTGQFTVTSVVEPTVGMTGLAPFPDTSACAYDSGAPYFSEDRRLKPTLVSIESGGPTCPHALEETTVRIDNITDWIRNITGHEYS